MSLGILYCFWGVNRSFYFILIWVPGMRVACIWKVSVASKSMASNLICTQSSTQLFVELLNNAPWCSLRALQYFKDILLIKKTIVISNLNVFVLLFFINLFTYYYWQHITRIRFNITVERAQTCTAPLSSSAFLIGGLFVTWGQVFLLWRDRTVIFGQGKTNMLSDLHYDKCY